MFVCFFVPVLSLLVCDDTHKVDFSFQLSLFVLGQSICCVDSCPFLRFRPAYVNPHLNWEDCLGYKLKLGKEGKTAFKFIEKAEAGDSKIDVSVAFLCGRAFHVGVQWYIYLRCVVVLITLSRSCWLRE